MIGVLAALSSAALLYVSTAPGTFGLLAWVAPLPLFWYALGPAPEWHVALAAFAAYAGGAANLVPVYSDRLPVAVLLGAMTLPALLFAGVLLLARRIVRWLPLPAGLLAFPALWTSVEMIEAWTSVHGTFGSLAYSQTGAPIVLQVASLTGFAGITFLLTLVSWGLALAARIRQSAPVTVGVLAVVVSASLAFGWVRLHTPPARDTVVVGLAASDATIPAFRTQERAEALDVVAGYAGRVRALAERGARMVVLPEKFVAVRPAWTGEARAALAAAARENRVLLVAGFNELPDEGAPRNLAVVFAPDGSVIAEYDKRHMLPPFESEYRVGTTIGILPSDVGVAICKDLDFVDTAKLHGRAGTGLLLVPAWDFVSDAQLHARMALLRAVEGGFALARTAKEGLLTVADAQGRVLAQTASSAGPGALLVVPVVPGDGRTIYARIGDVFGIGCVLLAAALVAAAEWSARRVRSGHRA